MCNWRHHSAAATLKTFPGGILTGLLDTLREALAGAYGVERELGRGGMATVFLAEDLKHRRQVAIKVLNQELSVQIGPERFAREIEIAARLQHPHILPLYDSGTTGGGGLLYYVMPLVEGESLRDRLDREKQLSQEEAVRIVTEVASALSYAHSRGVVHRDIKPENILLSGGTAVVADFGIARAIDDAGEQSLTKTGTIIGTPIYMSPEQATGATQIDGRSDQYSLACVLYELLVGQPPFTGPTAQAIIARHSLDMVSPPSIVRPGLPEALEDALLKALSKVPADRFATATLFVEALAVPSRPSTLRRRSPGSAVSGVRSRPWLKPAGAAAGLVILIGAAWGVLAAIRGNAGRGPGAGEPDPRRIAVLYFEHRGDSARTQYLADGLTESLIHELSAVKALHVISANGVRPFRNASARPDSLQRALGVGTIVQGTVSEDGNRLRVSVALVNAVTGTETKSTTLERPRAELFALQDTLSRAVAEFLRLAIGEEVQLRETRAATSDVGAWELVQQAAEERKRSDGLIAGGNLTAANAALAHADSLLAQASARDAKWTTPIVERGWLAWEQRRIVGLDKGPAAEFTDRGLRFADQALAIRPDTEAIHLRGTMRYIRYVINVDVGSLSGERLLAAAEADLRAGGAARSNPRRASAMSLLSHLLLRKSATAEGKLAALQAWEADEYLTEANSVLWRLYAASLDLEDAAEATKWCGEGYRRFPKDPYFTECRISLYAIRGLKPDVPALWGLVEQYAGLYPKDHQEYRRKRAQVLLSMALANAGLRDSARAVALRARPRDPTVDPTNDLMYLEIAARNVMGDREEAVRLLGQYLATNPQDRVSIARDETWFFRGLRDDPRFVTLVGTGR
ncbi:MAG TPA: serine/threonine-protein kinase [Gemmatimonadales bacterium]|nr:serine/threonine-protein kinase [Gemmatimonadales bacterium]